jgi:2-polyprenyl-3-methyl-5-hydroxy-6-metoxy-1,4-benzoquinol methylase
MPGFRRRSTNGTSRASAECTAPIKDDEVRDLNHEFSDNMHRKYAYSFDYHMHDYMLRTFGPFLPKGRALELGCYEGAFTARLSDLYDDLTVVEGASELIAKAQTRVGKNAKFVLGYFERFEPPTNFEAIFLLHTLEHIDEPVALLRRIKSWLSPGGRLFLAVPNAYAASRQIAVAMGLIASPTAVTEGELLHGHRRTYCLNTLKNDIAAAGLVDIESGGILFKPLANFQFDALLEKQIILKDYLDGCFTLGKGYPELCASIYAICEADLVSVA